MHPSAFVSIPLKWDNVLLRDTYTAGMDDPVNSQLTGRSRVCKRIQGAWQYYHRLHLLQVLAADFLQVSCTCKLCTYFFATMIYHPPSANPAVDSKLLDVVIHLAATAVGVVTDATNLVSRALALVGRNAGVTVEKFIPTGGGLGGGAPMLQP